MKKGQIRIIIIGFCLCAMSMQYAFGQQSTFRRNIFFGVEYNTEVIVDSLTFVFPLAEIFELEDRQYVKNGQLRSFDRVITPYDNLYYWSGAPVIPSKNNFVNNRKRKINLDWNQQQPFKAFSYHGTDPILHTPFQKIWSPVRNLEHAGYDKLGLSSRILFATYMAATPFALKDKKGFSGFIGGEYYGSWLIANSKRFGVSNLTLELGYKANINQNAPDLGEAIGSNIVSNVTNGNSAPIVGDIFYTQGFFQNKVMVSFGRLTPWYFYGYNTFTDDELTRMANNMMSGGTVMPEGGGNSTKPGMAFQLLLSEKFYANAVVTNPNGADSSFDFQFLNFDTHFAGAEFGFVYAAKNKLEGRISAGVHHSLLRKNPNEASRSGFGYTFLVQQELTPKGFSPYSGVYFQANYSDPNISSVTQQYVGGINIDHIFHRRNDGLGIGMGYSVSSNKAQRNEFLMDMFYRLQLTEAGELTADLQLFFNPADKAQKNSVVPILALRYIFYL